MGQGLLEEQIRGLKVAVNENVKLFFIKSGLIYIRPRPKW